MAVHLDFFGGYGINMQNPAALTTNHVLADFAEYQFYNGTRGTGADGSPLRMWNEETFGSNTAEIRVFGGPFHYDSMGNPDAFDTITEIDILSAADLDAGLTSWRLVVTFDEPAWWVDWLLAYSGYDISELYAGQALDVSADNYNDILVGGALDDTLSGFGGADKLTGGGGTDILAAGAGNDVLIGGAGDDYMGGATGKDTLTGGAGKDSFLFTSKAAATNVDTIKDFAHLSDKIALDNEFFTRLPADGAALGTRFFKGANVDVAGATATNQRILYDTDSGKLYYDPDGSGAAAKVQIAFVFKTGTEPASLTAADFIII
jgi:Ca2+-binding RTX toxin-like protein